MLQNPHLARALSPCGAAWPACCDADPIRSRARGPADSFESFRQSVESSVPGRTLTQVGQQGDRPLLGQRLVTVAALGGLDASRAAGFAIAGGDGLQSGRHPFPGAGETGERMPGTASERVVNEHGGGARVVVQLGG